MVDVFKILDIVDIVEGVQQQHLFWKRRQLNLLVYIKGCNKKTERYAFLAITFIILNISD